MNNSHTLRNLMLQKNMNSPVEKENSEYLDVIASKTISSPTQLGPSVLKHKIRSRQPLGDYDLNSKNRVFFSVPSVDSRSLNRLIDSQSVDENKNGSSVISQSKLFACPTVLNSIDDKLIHNVASSSRLSQSSSPADFSTLLDGDIIGQKSPVTKSICKHKNDLTFEDIKNTNDIVRKENLINEFECTSGISVTPKRLKPNVDLSMSFGSPTLDIENISLSAPVFQRKTTLFDYGFCKKKYPIFHRSFSTTDDTIKAALKKEDNGLNLIGDFSQQFILPLLSSSRHADLRSISPDTLAQLLDGMYDDFIDSYLIIDCRYPYEYEGGHIRGAVNIYTREDLLKSYTEDKLVKKSNKTTVNPNEKRSFLIFHCEFSSERGPNLYRYLRNADRHKNSICYPFLDHPEMYLLDGGYCRFYGQYGRLCEPSSYRSMSDPAHDKDFKKFRSKSKIWAKRNNKEVPPLARKNTFKRLGFN